MGIVPVTTANLNGRLGIEGGMSKPLQPDFLVVIRNDGLDIGAAQSRFNPVDGIYRHKKGGFIFRHQFSFKLGRDFHNQIGLVQFNGMQRRLKRGIVIL